MAASEFDRMNASLLEGVGGLSTMRMIVLLGGTVPETRKAEIDAGLRPRIDVVDLENQFGIPVRGFDWLEQRASEETALSTVMRLGANWSAWLAVRAALAMNGTDVVYVTGEDIGVPLAALLRLARVERPLLIMRLEQPTYGRSRWRQSVYRRIYRYSMSRVDLTMCRTERHAELLREWGVQADKVVFVPETTDRDFFSPQSPCTVPDSFELPSSPYIVSAGLEGRDYDTLIAAMRDLPVHLVIGAGSPWSKSRYDFSQDGLPANVTVSSFTPLEMRELYRSAELVVVPVKPTTRACGMNVVLEAWAMQKPVVASKTEGLQSYIEDRHTGLFAEPENAVDLQSKIEYALVNREEASQWASNGCERVKDELNLDRYLGEVLEYARRLTAQS